jgi:iron complex outermembrane receptor protein
VRQTGFRTAAALVVSCATAHADHVAGTVTDSAGRPLAGAVVVLDGGTARVTSDLQGRFHLSAAPGRHTVAVSRARVAAPVVRELDVPAAGTTLDVRLELLPTVSEEVVVQGVRAAEAAPVTATELGRAELERGYHGQEMPELLARTPSVVQYTETGTGAGYGYFFLRGLHQSRVNMTLDGAPLNDPEESAVFFANFGDFAAALQSVQVQRGVGTSSVGAASYAGSVNFESAAVTSADRRFDLEGTLGSWGTGRCTRAGRCSPPTASAAIRASTSARSTPARRSRVTARCSSCSRSRRTRRRGSRSWLPRPRCSPRTCA